MLWQRFASVLELDPARFDLDVRPNRSLGSQEVEFLRRLNQAMPQRYPARYARRITRDTLANSILANREGKEKIQLPQYALEWAEEYTEEVIATLKGSACPVVGDVEDLRGTRRETTVPEPSPPPEIPPVVQDALIGLLWKLGKRDDQKRALAAQLRKRGWPASAIALRGLPQHKRHRLKTEHAPDTTLAGPWARDRRASPTQQVPPIEQLKRAVVDLGDESHVVNYVLRVWRVGKRLVSGGSSPRAGSSR